MDSNLITDENAAVAKPFLPVIEAAMETHASNKDITSKGRFLQAILA
jgi:hypothetical protein